MSVVDKYIDYVKEEAMKRPEKSWNKILLGFQGEQMADAPASHERPFQRLSEAGADDDGNGGDSLSREGSYVWGNIFTPCELVHCFGLRTLSIEVLSCYMSGFHLEDYFIDYAQDIGLAPTLCSYHKTFVEGWRAA